MLYLDHNATTHLHPKVKELVINLLDGAYNPSSIHTNGRSAKNIIETARMQIAKSVGIDINSREYELIFTSSGTESNNLLINSYMDGEIFISGIEHLSIFAHTKYRDNFKVINVNSDGIVDIQHLAKLLSTSPSSKKLVSIMLANNETGVIQNIKELAMLARQYGAIFHSDCVQAVGKIPVNIPELGLDFATISSHKLGGMQGSSVLIARRNHMLKAMIVGGGQEKNIRPGTENVVAIASFGFASEIAAQEVMQRYQNMSKLQADLELNLRAYPNLTIASKNATRLPNTTLMVLSKGEVHTKLISLDLQGIAVSIGSACSSGKVSKSHVLSAMGFSDTDAKSSIRVSFSYDQTTQDVITFINAFKEIYSSY
ncbi:cysteine desulfurase family protein [Candidatus Tisiphia endosymbiont of Nemotelus uliginosus]|uniref:cysteine desulfurase family protein n=1 Tax=Candidatus Tisiphia endosymbiont of Nemotelus uliginosus TaxID=3077926 RepID=UPI0035C882C2